MRESMEWHSLGYNVFLHREEGDGGGGGWAYAWRGNNGRKRKKNMKNGEDEEEEDIVVGYDVCGVVMMRIMGFEDDEDGDEVYSLVGCFIGYIVFGLRIMRPTSTKYGFQNVLTP